MEDFVGNEFNPFQRHLTGCSHKSDFDDYLVLHLNFKELVFI